MAKTERGMLCAGIARSGVCVCDMTHLCRLLCALVMLIVGVPVETVVNDYCASEKELLRSKKDGLPRIAKYEVHSIIPSFSTLTITMHSISPTLILLL